MSPTLTCPVDSYIYTLDPDRTPAVWGPPYATDNVGVANVLATETHFYDWLSVGQHRVYYKALDKAGNVESCTFNVHVMLLGEFMKMETKKYYKHTQSCILDSI